MITIPVGDVSAMMIAPAKLETEVTNSSALIHIWLGNSLINHGVPLIFSTYVHSRYLYLPASLTVAKKKLDRIFEAHLKSLCKRATMSANMA